MAGVPDITPEDAWAAIRSDPAAVLVDVRTDAEWNFVGVPDLAEAAKQVVLIPWQSYPAMQVNPAFLEQLARAGATPQHKLYFLCRSGARSMSAALAAVQAGFPHCFNVADGFEGPLDAEGHRGLLGGWKAAGLPWRQR